MDGADVWWSFAKYSQLAESCQDDNSDPIILCVRLFKEKQLSVFGHLVRCVCVVVGP